jgi:hypothetical protein
MDAVAEAAKETGHGTFQRGGNPGGAVYSARGDREGASIACSAFACLMLHKMNAMSGKCPRIGIWAAGREVLQRGSPLAKS